MSDRGRSRLLALAISLFVSAVLVVSAFNPAPHNGGDNAAYVTLAYSLAQHGTYTDLYDPAGLPHTKYPPVFPGLLVVLLLLGARTWTALKAVTALSTIAAVGFVGSTPIAQYIYGRACSNGKRAQCFGGAKNHMIIMPDADLDKAADALGAAGDDVDFGPVITAQAKARINGLIDSGVEQGAKLVVDGRGFQLQGYENGFFCGPSLFDNVTPEMDIYREEIFGPVLSQVRMDSYEDALNLIIDNDYGNGTAIYTADGDTARDFAHRVNVGMVGINFPIPVPLSYHTFGGWKKSAFGDLNQYGPDAFRFYTKTKTVTARWFSGIKEGGEFNFKAMD